MNVPFYYLLLLSVSFPYGTLLFFFSFPILTSEMGNAKMPTRLMLCDPKLFPVQAFFNAISDRSFLRVVDCLTNRIGYSINDTDCTFPDDLDATEEPFIGVRFSLFDDVVIITLSQLQQYIQTVCADYVYIHPDTKQLLDQYLARYQ